MTDDYEKYNGESNENQENENQNDTQPDNTPYSSFEDPQTDDDNETEVLNDAENTASAEENSSHSQGANDNYYQNGQAPYSAPNYGYNQQQYNAGAQPNSGNPYYQNQQNPNYHNPYGNPNQPQYNVYTNPPTPPQGQPPKKKKNTGLKVFFGIIIGVLVIIVAAIVIAMVGGADTDTKDTNEKNTSNNVGSLSISEGESSASSSNATDVYKKVVKSNVGLLVYANNTLYTEGSGVIAKEGDDGYTYIITCAHVISKGSKVVVQTYDKEEYDAQIVGYDTRSDLGVVRIKVTGLDCATFGNSDNLEVGQTVYAIGNPQGSQFAGSFTSGMVSAIDRPVSSSTGYEMKCIQHTAAINPGNSGGALLNNKGEVVGINSMKIASTDTEGMGFSVPSSVVKEVFDSIVANGYVTGRVKLGITYAAASSYDEYSMYVAIKDLPSGSIVIASIADDSALKDTDAQVGDLIVGVNGKEMTSTGMLAEMIENMSVGDELTLNLVRIDTRNWTQTDFDVKVKLVEDKGDTTVSDDSDSQDNNSENSGGMDQDDLERYFEEYFKNYNNGN